MGWLLIKKKLGKEMSKWASKIIGRIGDLSGIPRLTKIEQLRTRFIRKCPSSMLVRDGYDIRTLQELLGHKDVSMTMVYTYVLNKRAKAVRSSLDTI